MRLFSSGFWNSFYLLLYCLTDPDVQLLSSQPFIIDFDQCLSYSGLPVTQSVLAVSMWAQEAPYNPLRFTAYQPGLPKFIFYCLSYPKSVIDPKMQSCWFLVYSLSTPMTWRSTIILVLGLRVHRHFWEFVFLDLIVCSFCFDKSSKSEDLEP